MKTCLLDTGPMVALFNKSDEHHLKTVEFLKTFKGKFVTSLATITEAIYLLDYSKDTQNAFLEWISRGAIKIEEVSGEDLLKVVALFQKYSDLPMDFADGCLVALAEKLGTNNVATIDSDFEIYRINRNKKFKIHIGR